MLRRSQVRSRYGDREIEIIDDSEIEKILVEGENTDDILVNAVIKATIDRGYREYSIGERRRLRKRGRITTSDKNYYIEIELEVEKYAYGKWDH